MAANPGVPFDGLELNKCAVNVLCVNESLSEIPEEKYKLNGIHRAAWLLRAVSCIDLTTLAADDTRSNVVALYRRALRPIKPSLLNSLRFRTNRFTTAAVCVYPSRVSDICYDIRSPYNVPVAAVAAGFPSGQYCEYSRKEEIMDAVRKGAREIDIVIDRSLVLTGKWNTLYNEIRAMKNSCGNAKMKTIISTTDLSTLENVHKASLVAMMAGSDFIKTSTGKEGDKATLPAGLVILRAIRNYERKTKAKVGFKVAGGIRTAEDALDWLILVKREMGNSWLQKDLFRIGASSLLDDIEKNLESLAKEIAVKQDA